MQEGSRFRTYVLGLLTAIMFLPLSLKAQSIKNYVPMDSLRVGDTLPYSIVLKKDQNYDGVIFPDTAAFGQEFEIYSRKRYRINDFTDSLAYTLQFFGTKDTLIGRLPVKLIAGTDTTTLYTSPVPIHFKSTLKAKDEQFSPLKPIFDFALLWWPYLLAFIILAVAGYFFYRWYKKKQEEQARQSKPKAPPPPFVNPLHALTETLDQLQTDDSIRDHHDFKTFYIKLGDAIRLYYEQLYKIPALESTTGELMRELNKRAVDDELVKHTRDILYEADMVKFAKFTPTLDQAFNSLSKAENFRDLAREVHRERIQHLRSEYDHRIRQMMEDGQDEDDEQQQEPEEKKQQPETDKQQQEVQEST